MRMKNIKFPNLAAEMSREGIYADDIAEVLDITPKTARDKLNRKYTWSDKEMKRVRNRLFPGMTLDYLFHSEEDEREDAVVKLA